MECPLKDSLEKRLKIIEALGDIADEIRTTRPEVVRGNAILNGLEVRINHFYRVTNDLLDYLKTALPVKFTKEDRDKIQSELDSLVNASVESIRKERDDTLRRIAERNERISLTHRCFWMLVTSLILLSLFFILIIYANITFLRIAIIHKLSIIFILTVCISIYAIFYTLRKHKR